MSRSVLMALKIAGVTGILVVALLCILAITGLIPDPVLKKVAVRVFMVIVIVTAAVIGVTAIVGGSGGNSEPK